MSECPICYEATTDAVRTKCAHEFCLSCFESSLKPWGGSCPMCRTSVSRYSTILVSSGAPLATPDVDTVFGLVFLQAGADGVASYHFDSPEDIYISYTQAPAGWKLDDGSRPPAKKPFTDTTYDASSRTFEGTILWSEAAFGGAAKWVYRMEFSEDYNIICGGEMLAFGTDGVAQGEPSQFVKKLIYWRQRPLPTTILGATFVQGGMPGLASYHFDQALTEPYISYEHAPPSWLQDDGMPMAGHGKKPFASPAYDAESRTFTGTVEWSPTTVHGDARWQYTMIFSADFSTVGSRRRALRAALTLPPAAMEPAAALLSSPPSLLTLAGLEPLCAQIEGGQVVAFGADGGQKATHKFGTHLHYERLVAEREQLLALRSSMV